MKQFAGRKRVLGLILLLCMFTTSFAACKNNEKQPESDTNDTTPVGSDEVEFVYQYPDMNLAGKTYKILNTDRMTWAMIGYITSDEYNTDEINNAAYTRAKKVESELGCSIIEVNTSIYNLQSSMVTAMSGGGQDVFAAGYQRMDETVAGIVSGLYQPLDGINTLNLDKDWWARDLLKATSLGGKHYYASSDLQLMSFDSVWEIFFNYDILNDKGIEAPYQLVRDGKWTISALQSLCAEICNLNGEETWTYSPEGRSLYGLSTFMDGIRGFLFGTEALMADSDASGYPYVSCNNEIFYTKAQKLGDYIATPGSFLYADASNYTAIFRAGRAAFNAGEVANATFLTEVEFRWGILPYPKYDEDQESYHHTVISMLPVLTVPAQNSEPEEVGAILDALSYEAYEKLAVYYYENRINLRGTGFDLTSDIEMMEVIRKTRGVDLLVATCAGTDLEKNIIWSVAAGGTDIVSSISKYKGEVEQTLAKLKLKIMKD